jgi:hypothetical protein
VLGIICWLAWLRARNPNAADAVAAAWYGYGAYRAHNQGHNLTAAANIVGVGVYAAQIDQRRVAEQQSRQADADYWTQVAAQPLDYQWQIADWFRSQLQAEYARRTHGRVAPRDAPVPTYEDFVAYLNASPIPW